MEKRFSEIKLIIGLGNPGPEYENTYHNAGKLMVDYLLENRVLGSESGNAGFHKKTSGNFESCAAGGLILVKPTNYMNENGRAAKAALKSFGTKVDSILVAHDDSDIEIGKYKISFGSGSAGHNGVESVIESTGTKNFWRLRIGIGKPGKINKVKAGELVLKKITAADRELMRSVFEDASGKLLNESTAAI